MSPLLLGFLRGIALAAVIGGLTFLGDATNLSGVLNPATASLVAALALALEHVIEAHTGKALFGAAKGQAR